MRLLAVLTCALAGSGTSGAFDSWHSDDFIRVAQYWLKKPIKRTLALLPDGTIEDLTDQIKDVPKEHVKTGLDFLRRQKTGADRAARPLQDLPLS